QRSREDDRPGSFTAGCAAGHRLERLASHEERVERREERLEVDVLVHDDPVGLALRSGDVTVEAHGNLVANASFFQCSRGPHPRSLIGALSSTEMASWRSAQSTPRS